MTACGVDPLTVHVRRCSRGASLRLWPICRLPGPQRVLVEPTWRERLSEVDRRALTPLFWSNVNPYGRFRLDMDRHLETTLAGLPDGPPLAAATE